VRAISRTYRCIPLFSQDAGILIEGDTFYHNWYDKIEAEMANCTASYETAHKGQEISNLTVATLITTAKGKGRMLGGMPGHGNCP